MSHQRALVPICFDVLGTCFSFHVATQALQKVFPTLSQQLADAVIGDWFHSAQLTFTYLSMNGDYQPIAQVLKSTLPRIYLMHNLVSPSTRDASSGSSRAVPVDPSLVDPVIQAIPRMTARPGLQACTRLLDDSKKFKLLAVTNGGLETTKGYFYNAFSNEGQEGGKQAEGKRLVEEEFKWSFLSCDDLRIAKPDRRVYENVWKKLDEDPESQVKTGNREGWFVASHTWDLHAAKKSGFKTAFVTYEEHLVLPELFGQPDLVGKDLQDIARKIIEHEQSNGTSAE